MPNQPDGTIATLSSASQSFMFYLDGDRKQAYGALQCVSGDQWKLGSLDLTKDAAESTKDRLVLRGVIGAERVKLIIPSNSALSKMARDKGLQHILKQPVRGKNYCVKALNLASSLHPRVFTFVPWHQTASDIVKAYQEEVVARERSAWEAKRKPYLEKLAPKLKKLEEASTEGLDSLIDMIYDKHPPLNKKHTKPTAEGKKRIQHAIRHYHPDKGNVSEETKVLLEEITKLLTAHLNAAKGL
ncbi:uncharacterized protein MONBRDRAFT_11216 [Monosiga brevicollis MX1]|uniref:J domain-containing protein n=1 Tax=Monosiga brevicollis TaxID=81824 RepID=A9V8J9_MONBE|nr:uncharacterized protein MONBRDRAFT_11216 [Monosiga brevicollis MX1]EDQ86157.1 predicted protein [Monosiga brevicollis MX1]|eukprot:XP_001749082.1 hypothetical protein [Monosiga brevicollis MX1]